MTRSRTRRETSAGGVVFRRGERGTRYLLILDGNGNWGFPKGHLARGETPLDAARREVQEETALSDLELRGELGVIEWFFRARGQLVHKHCHLFLFESATGEAAPQLEEGITECSWRELDDALGAVTYENARTALRTAGNLVQTLNGGSAVAGS